MSRRHTFWHSSFQIEQVCHESHDELSYRGGQYGVTTNDGDLVSPAVNFPQTSLLLLIFLGIDFDVIVDVIHITPDDEWRETFARPGTHKTTHERFHGVVKRSEEEDGAGKPENAQFWDLEEAWSRVEAADGDGEKALHWRGEKAEVSFSI